MKYLANMLVALAAMGCVAGDVALLRAQDSPGKQVVQVEDAAWRPLFDGRTLNGWHEFGEKGHWTVVDGALLGNARDPQQYALLVTDNDYTDFTLKVKFKFREGNSGVYIRSQTHDPDEARGPQVEIAPHGGNSTSGIYESYGRNWFAQPVEADMVKIFKPDAWNEFVISAQGAHIVVHFNGVKTVDFEDPQGPRSGHIILQQHSGTLNWVMFKDIEIQED